MRTASPQLITLLNEDQFLMADLYTITTVQGDVYRYTNYDFDLMVGGHQFSSNGPIISREGISLSLGVEVDNLSVTIEVTNEQTFEGIRVVQAFHNGQMDGARFKLERIFLSPSRPTDIVKLLYYSYRIRKKLEITHRLNRSTILYAYV